MPISRGSTPQVAVATMRARGVSPARRHRFGGDDQGRRTVVQARGVAGGDAAGLTERGFQRLQLIKGGVGARVFIWLNSVTAPFAGEADRGYLLRRWPSACARAARCWLRSAKAS